jgi:hypothetical protein
MSTSAEIPSAKCNRRIMLMDRLWRRSELRQHGFSSRTIEPDREVWFCAGVLSGLLSRLQDYGAADRRRVLNDALIFETARKHGFALITECRVPTAEAPARQQP